MAKLFHRTTSHLYKTGIWQKLGKHQIAAMRGEKLSSCLTGGCGDIAEKQVYSTERALQENSHRSNSSNSFGALADPTPSSMKFRPAK